MALSALVAGYEAITRFFHPRPSGIGEKASPFE
jgi:hypothetical protein